MATIPKVLIKKGSTVTDIYATYSMMVVDFPFVIQGKPKNIASRSYYDQNGDYEFIPSTIYYEPTEFTIRFAYKGSKQTAQGKINTFLTYISGAELSIYSEFIKLGRQKCRVSDEPEVVRFYSDGNKDLVEFTVKFKCNDPNTNITLALA